jgi:hypothetical protein
VLIYDIGDKIACYEYLKNNDIVRKRQEALDAKQNEIVENLDNVSLKEVKDLKKEANALDDSDHE